MSRPKPETRNLVSEDVAQIMLINVKERRRLLLAGAAIAIALLLVTLGPTSPGSFVGVSAVSGEGARTPAATNKAPVVAGKSSPARGFEGNRIEPDERPAQPHDGRHKCFEHCCVGRRVKKQIPGPRPIV